MVTWDSGGVGGKEMGEIEKRKRGQRGKEEKAGEREGEERESIRIFYNFFPNFYLFIFKFQAICFLN